MSPPHRQSPDFSNSDTVQLEEIKQQLSDIWCCLNGKDGKLGLSQKVAIMWGMHLWVAYALGTLSGGVVTAFVLQAFGLLK